MSLVLSELLSTIDRSKKLLKAIGYLLKCISIESNKWQNSLCTYFSDKVSSISAILLDKLDILSDTRFLGCFLVTLTELYKLERWNETRNQ
jgi:hypothetical protein